MLNYVVEKIIELHEEKVRERTCSGQPALCIFDTFATHKTEYVKTKLGEMYVKHVFIKPGYTGELQPLELNVNDYLVQ